MQPTPREPYGQRDPRWAKNFLGNSNLTIGRYGCTTTSICNGLRYFGAIITPAQLAMNPSNYTREGYPDGAGLIIWDQLTIPGGFHCIKRIGNRWAPKRDDAAIQKSLKDPNEFVILQVDNGQHWVLALGKTLFGNDYRIEDPWFGDKRTAIGTYRNITGSAHFRRH